MTKHNFDYLILGGGAAGLSVASGLAKSGKKIGIIEKESKNSNDRTWSFWEKGAGVHDDIVHHKWTHLNFYASKSIVREDMDPYRYKMVRSADFYKKLHTELQTLDNVHYIQDEVVSTKEEKDYVSVNGRLASYTSHMLLDSIFRPEINPSETLYVAQHFGGWFVKTEKPAFDPTTATLMDFRIDQEGETRFFYVLPTSETEALVEIAIFSNDILQPEEYDPMIESYIEDYLSIGKYEIAEKESGVIPMTTYPFHKHNTDRIIRIGTSGGWVKPSSGYAFKRILEKSEELVNQLLDGKKPNVESSPWHKWMDRTMLKAILYNYASGKDAFDSLFGKSSPAEVFQFLDEENTTLENLRIMSSSPIVPFTRAAFARPW